MNSHAAAFLQPSMPFGEVRVRNLWLGNLEVSSWEVRKLDADFLANGRHPLQLAANDFLRGKSGNEHIESGRSQLANVIVKEPACARAAANGKLSRPWPGHGPNFHASEPVCR
jgi:hypothetical protein